MKVDLWLFNVEGIPTFADTLEVQDGPELRGLALAPLANLDWGLEAIRYLPASKVAATVKALLRKGMN